MGEGAAAKVDIDTVEGQTLGLMDGEGPGEPQRKLLERAGDRFDDFVGVLVERVAPAFPGDGLDLVFLAGKRDPDVLVRQPGDAGDAAVNPAFVGVVAQQDDLGAGLELERASVGWAAAE